MFRSGLNPWIKLFSCPVSVWSNSVKVPDVGGVSQEAFSSVLFFRRRCVEQSIDTAFLI